MPEQPSSGILTSGDGARVMQPAVTASDIAADDLPDMPRWLMPMHRRWGRPRLPVDFATAYGTARLVPVSPIRLQAWTGNWATVRFALSDRELSVSCPIDVVLGLSARRFPELPFANLDRELAAAVVDHLLGDMVTLAERVFAPGLRVMRIDLPAMPPELGGRLFDVALEDHMQFPLHVAGAGQDMEVLERIVADWPVARQNLSSIKVPISLRAGFARLTLDGLAALEVGSGIILDRTFLTFQKIAIVTGERFVQTSTYQNMRPVLDGPLLRIPDPATTEYTMGAAMNEILEDESSAPFGSVRDVPVHLVFELGRTSLTVGELEAVGQGHVFELSKPLNEAVEILSGGRRIGTGSLVRIGDAIGVRVSRIAT